ncbi:NUDIX hydrolase [Termitidicoccus mucosus]|uniref:GDP-mannose pyrophosphatase n=1 Tax=Termitidicoccus mucosus TaxID=1184151 RepID=A0A178IJ18_9BACT|nr:NUDIX hydrolase [Opitutaceae bacterium TSB47]
MSDSSDHMPSRWEKRSEQIVTRTRIFDLRSTYYHHPVRATGRDFYVMHSPDWVNVVALTPDHRMVLVRQFRFGIDDFSIEIPGGVMDHAGEDAIAAGLRELREETGYAGANARLLGRVHPNPAIMSNRCHLVLVEQCERVAEFAWDPDEEMEVTLAPVDEVYEWARTGRITHSLVLDALLLFAPIWEKMRA